MLRDVVSLDAIKYPKCRGADMSALVNDKWCPGWRARRTERERHEAEARLDENIVDRTDKQTGNHGRSHEHTAH